MTLPVSKIYIFGNKKFCKQKDILEKLGFNVMFNTHPSNNVKFEDFVKIMNWCDLIIIPKTYCDSKENNFNMLNVIQAASSTSFNKEIWVVKNEDETSEYDEEKVCLFNSWFEIYSELHP